MSRKLSVGVLSALLAAAGVAEARGLFYGVVVAYDKEAGYVHRGGGEGLISASSDGGASYAPLAGLSFDRRAWDLVRLRPVRDLAPDALVRLEVAFEEGAQGTPLPVLIEGVRDEFLSNFEAAPWGYLGYLHLSLVFADEGNLVDVARKDGRFETLLAALALAGLDDDLQGPGPFTVFAPTDAAFDLIPEAFFSALLDNVDELTDILLYHVVSGNLDAADVSASDRLQTLLGPDVTVSITTEGVFINDAKVILADVSAANGTIHVIDAVLLPPPNIVETARQAGTFTTLVAALEATGLDVPLSEDGPFTVFAPTDDAFAVLGTEAINALLADPDALAEILKYHVVEGRVRAADVVTVESLTTLLGQDVTVTVEGVGAETTVKINEAVVQIVDLEARNGIVHVIDAVLIPAAEPSILEIAESAGAFSILLGALEATGLDEALSGVGPFTVFAPTDEAFGRLPEWLLTRITSDPDVLAKVLLYHVVAGENDLDALVEDRWVRTLNGASVYVRRYRNEVYVNGSRVADADIAASNGMIHVIDRVMIPFNIFR